MITYYFHLFIFFKIEIEEQLRVPSISHLYTQLGIVKFNNFSTTSFLTLHEFQQWQPQNRGQVHKLGEASSRCQKITSLPSQKKLILLLGVEATDNRSYEKN